ncbi:MAG: hypothetical protein EZS28_043375, partial [Streblomastix strix]
GIRGVCCCGYARIGGINILGIFLTDVVLCRDLSTVYIAACSIYQLDQLELCYFLTVSLLGIRGSLICVYGGFTVAKNGFSGWIAGN